VIDPLGGINSLWPIFGVANQLIAVIALSLGTTVLIKMGRTRYFWVSLLPLVWLLSVTMKAGLQKIFSPDRRLGFLSAATQLRGQIAAGGTDVQVAGWKHLLLNQYINVGVTACFLVLFLLVLLTCVRQWWLLLSKRKASVLHEDPYAVEVALRP